MVVCFESFTLLLQFFLHMAALEGVDVGGFEVDFTESPRIAYLLYLKLLFFADFFHHSYFLLANVFFGVSQ